MYINQLSKEMVDELAGIMAGLKHPTSPVGKQANEAFSLLAGFAAGFDEHTARLFLGGDSYKPFVKSMAAEIERLVK